MTDDDWYESVGAVLGILVGFVTFAGSWIYCMSTYGFLFGFGLGWLPSIILAFIVAAGVRFLWGLAAAGLLLLGIYVFLPGQSGQEEDDFSIDQNVSVPDPAIATTSDWFEPLARGETLDWVADEAPNKVYHRVGDLTLTISKRMDGELVAPVIEINGDGKTVQIEGQMAQPYLSHKVSALEIAKGKPPVVLLQSFSGGAHCCNVITLAGVFGQALKTVDLGSWDGSSMELPKDLSGDGKADFVMRDDSFLYAFAPYALSWSPPTVLNIERGTVVDVSSRPAFRRLFEEDMKRATAECKNGNNGACAAYVADAARAGSLDQAWSDMLDGHDPQSIWEWPTDCLVKTESTCPRNSTVVFSNYPDSLLFFLKKHGYIPYNWMPPT